MTALPWVQTIWTRHDLKTQWARKIVFKLPYGGFLQPFFVFFEQLGSFSLLVGYSYKLLFELSRFQPEFLLL
jgi:hypothetical protein